MGLANGKCLSQARLEGKTAIVTGCNTGIGKETVKDFFKRGARVILACRNLEKANAAVEEIKKECANETKLGQMQVQKLDLTSLNSVRSFAKTVLNSEKRIDLLVNNAGVMMCPYSKTEDGFEMQFGTNHLGHFLLTMLLLPKICQSTPARIVTVSSMAHAQGSAKMNFDDLNWETRKYSALEAYQQSKLANVLFVKELARKIEEAKITGVTVYSLHPGVIKTELGRHLDDVYFRGARCVFKIASPLLKNPDEGAQTTIYCSVDENCANETGLYYSDCVVKEPSTNAQDAAAAERLWKESLKLVGLGENYDPFKQTA